MKGLAVKSSTEQERLSIPVDSMPVFELCLFLPTIPTIQSNQMVLASFLPLVSFINDLAHRRESRELNLETL
jgi:hypothetical protein